MSRKERERMTVMAGVTDRKLTLVQASKLMRVSYRQSKRIWKRYQADGDAGLVHRLRGQPSARRKPPELRALALARYGEERYADFGPTLMAEPLLKEKVVVDHETLRRWRLAEGQHTVRRRQQKHRQWRERKPSFGAMVQLDGSHHDWLEGRGPQCVLMVKRYQLDRQHEALSLVRRKVIVRTLRNGRMQLVYQGQLLQWRALPAGAARAVSPLKVKLPRRVKTKPERAPAGNHPWRRDGVGVGKRYWNGIKAEGRRTRAASRLGIGPPVGLRYAPASLRTRSPAGANGERTTNNKGDILS